MKILTNPVCKRYFRLQAGLVSIIYRFRMLFVEYQKTADIQYRLLNLYLFKYLFIKLYTFKTAYYF